MGLPASIDPSKRNLQRNLERDLSRAHSQGGVRLYPPDDFVGIAKLGDEPLHHRSDLGQDGLPLAPRLDAILQRLRVPDANCMVTRTGKELLAVGPPRQRIDIIKVAAQPRHLLEGLGVPDAHVVVEPAAGDALAVRTVGGAEHAIGVADQIVQERAARCVPDPHGSIIGGRQDSVAVGAESH